MTAEAQGVIPAPPKPLRTPDLQDEVDIREVLKDARELEHAEQDPPAPRPREDEPVPGLKFLTGIMKATFFTDLFCYHAEIRYAHPTRAERVSAHADANPFFYRACRNADFIARAILMTLVVGLVTATAIGTVVKLFF